MLGDAFLRDIYVAIDYDENTVDMYGHLKIRSINPQEIPTNQLILIPQQRHITHHNSQCKLNRLNRQQNLIRQSNLNLKLLNIRHTKLQKLIILKASTNNLNIR